MNWQSNSRTFMKSPCTGRLSSDSRCHSQNRPEYDLRQPSACFTNCWEASDDLERVTSQSRKGLHIETIQNAHRCSLSEPPSEKPCSRSEILVGKSCSRPETPSCIVKLESASKTRPSRESLEQVADDDFRKQLELSLPLHKPGKWHYVFQMSSFTTTILNLLFAEAEHKGQDTQFSYLHWTRIGRFECRQTVPQLEVQSLGHCDHFFVLNGARRARQSSRSMTHPNLGTQSRAIRGSMMSRRSFIDKCAV